MNPKGLKPTITSNFKKPQQEIEFLNHEMMLMRSPKDIGKEWVNFRCSNYLSKPEIKQYLMKVYNLNVLQVHTMNKTGKIMRNNMTNGGFRKSDWKKAMVKVDFEVDPELQKFV